MTHPPSDLAAARASMVDGQLRPSRVRDRAVLDAMRTLPRECFVPDGLREVAYADKALPLGEGRHLLEPLTIARMVELSRPVRGERALVVASGAGFGAALLAHLGLEVIALETSAALRERAGVAWREAGVAARITDRSDLGLDGLVQAGESFGLILVDGAVASLGESFARLLAPEGGRLVAILNEAGHSGRAIIAERSGTRLGWRALFDAQAATLPGFDATPGFRF